MLFNLYLLTKVKRKKLFGTLRVTAYAVVVCAGVGALTVRSAVADAEEQSMQLGRKLSDLGDLLQGANEFRLNDQKIFFSTTASDDSVKTVLDRFEAHCNKSPAFESMDWKSLADAKGKNVTDIDKSMKHLGVMRKEDAKVGDGMVVCFTGDNGPKSFYTALRSFEATGDLHDLGDIRYVHVQKRTRVTKQDIAGKPTLVQTMWTDGSFNIHAIMGEPGKDAPGSDFVTLPRPIDSTRRFTAEALNTPYSARIYESKASGTAIIADYTRKMEAQGWLTVHPPAMDLADGDGRLFTHVETAEQAAISVNKDGDHSMVVVGSMGVAGDMPKSMTRPY